MRRIVFSLFLFRLRLPVRFFSYSTQSRQNFYAQVRRRSFHTAWTHIGPQRKAALRFIFTKSLFARLQTQPFFSETEIVR